MAVSLQKFNQFVADLAAKVHNLGADTLMVLLTNTAPNVADTVVDTTTGTCTVKATSNAAEITAANGYVKKGAQIASNSLSSASGTTKLIGNAVTYTASGGAIGPFRYAVLFNDTAATTATRPVIGFWDYGSSITLNDGEALKLGKDTTGANWDTATPILSIT